MTLVDVVEGLCPPLLLDIIVPIEINNKPLNYPNIKITH